MKVGRFLAAIAPDLLAVGRALYDALDGDPVRAREVLAVVKNHGAELDAERILIDRELAKMRAARGQGTPDA